MRAVQLTNKPLNELQEMAEDLEIPAAHRLPKSELVSRIMQSQNQDSRGVNYYGGVLEILPEGMGFLRPDNYTPGVDDIYVSPSQIKRFALMTGDSIIGQVRPPKESEKFYSLLRVESVNGLTPEEAKRRKDFDQLTPVYANERLKLEAAPTNIAARFIDLVAPVGKGTRGLIIAPAKVGKTTLLKTIANSISENYPDVEIIILLIDERPEEVTDMRESVRGRVISSTFDELPENHMRVSDLALEQAKRMVECGKDVVILLDSLTRLSRASNLTTPPSGRTLSGGLDPVALYRPRRFFGAGRNFREGGSLTILATILVDTGSRMDEAIYEEFKGTGNMDLVLDRGLFERRVFPAIDIKRSGTRHEELLYTEEEYKQVWTLRRALANLDTQEATELLINRLKKTKSNQEFLQIVDKSLRGADND
ncbi:MAG: transcription termination factor Rho [Armatimonadetes bacterium]|nr:transcription termination factor Rho [Armatimonadota bacterium]